MEPEGLSPHSQQPPTYPYPELDPSSLYPPSNLSKIRLNIILPSTPGSSKFFPSLRFSHSNAECTSSLPHMCYMSCPSQSSWLDDLNICWGVQSIKPLVMQSFHYPFTSSLLGPNILLSTLFSKTLSHIPPPMWATNFHNHTKPPSR